MVEAPSGVSSFRLQTDPRRLAVFVVEAACRRHRRVQKFSDLGAVELVRLVTPQKTAQQQIRDRRHLSIADRTLLHTAATGTIFIIQLCTAPRLWTNQGRIKGSRGLALAPNGGMSTNNGLLYCPCTYREKTFYWMLYAGAGVYCFIDTFSDL